MKTSELTGPILDWAVAKAEGIHNEKVNWINTKISKRFWWTDVRGVSCSPQLATALFDMRRGRDYSPSTHWEQGGPIIEREKISLEKRSDWIAHIEPPLDGAIGPFGFGPTPLIAVMRCYVASKLGDDVEVPSK